MSRIDVGKQFLADLLARVPEENRAAVAAGLESSDEALGLIGDGVLRQSDYSKNMNALSAEHQKLTDWYNLNKAALDAAASGVTGNPAPTPTSTGMTRAEMETLLNERERGVASFIAASSDLAIKHFKEFGEVLDQNALLADPEVNKLGILGVYERKFAPRYQEKAKLATDQLIAAKVAEGVAEARKSFTSAPPYPTSPMDLSPLDVLDPNPGANPHSAQAAADEYTRLVNEKATRTH